MKLNRSGVRPLFIAMAIMGLVMACNCGPVSPEVKGTVDSAPTGPVCDMVPFLTGSTFWGVVCTDVTQIVKGVVDGLPTTAADMGPNPCPLVQIKHKDGSNAGSVCSAIAPAVQAALGK